MRLDLERELKALNISYHQKEAESTDVIINKYESAGVHIDKYQSAGVRINKYRSSDVSINKYDDDHKLSMSDSENLLTPDIMRTGVGGENHEISMSDSHDVPNNLIIKEPMEFNQLPPRRMIVV